MSVLAPAVVGVNAQLPAATVPTQSSAPSLTVTFPLGVPPPDVTVNATVTACPTTTLALQLWVPSLTVTVPVGVPLPGAFAATVNVKLTACPTADGFGVCPVMVVVVPAAVTAWGSPVELLPPKMALPA